MTATATAVSLLLPRQRGLALAPHCRSSLTRTRWRTLPVTRASDVARAGESSRRARFHRNLECERCNREQSSEKPR
ncbi:hypothetical protein [Haladaptatus litoreus]|uniref:hypothetical protein n=1 Tax=Haladaptatus litoreus TaxID=553468 RepID=UPI001115884B|nr:hypothetical protein [Haladaptatus litoreus]